MINFSATLDFLEEEKDSLQMLSVDSWSSLYIATCCPTVGEVVEAAELVPLSDFQRHYQALKRTDESFWFICVSLTFLFI